MRSKVSQVSVHEIRDDVQVGQVLGAFLVRWREQVRDRHDVVVPKHAQQLDFPQDALCVGHVLKGFGHLM